jgi:hypothetical protein
VRQQTEDAQGPDDTPLAILPDRSMSN